MFENLLLVTLVIVVLWVAILGLFLVIARRQPDVQAEMKALDEQLQNSEREAAPK
jgi:hypothetical protein